MSPSFRFGRKRGMVLLPSSVVIAAVIFVVSLGFPHNAVAQTKKAAPAPKAAPAAKAPAAKAPSSSASKSGGTTTAGHSTGTTTAGHTTATTTAGHTTGTTTAGHTTATTTSTKTTSNTAGAGTGKTTAGNVPKSTTPSTTKGTATAHTAGGPAAGHTPVGSHEIRTANGSSIRTRANGQRADVHDAKRGMDIHHGLDGNRRVSVERADHSRVVSERGGRGYVQHPYRYGGRDYGRRTYYDHGRYYDHYYGGYYYRGEYVDVYAPSAYYSVGFYGWAYNPWVAPINYSWGWGGAPWYGYYGAYFTPYPVYPSAAFWLTDYLFSATLQAAYANAEANAIAAGSAPPPLSPDVKQMVADEVKSQLALENSEATANAQNQAADPASSSIERMLSDNKPHVFIAGSNLDLVDTNGQECAISQGDVLEVTSAPAADATAATALVAASKGGKECARSINVNVAFTDLQDMQNHLRETIDAGMGDLQAKQGKGGLPAAPPSATTPPVAAALTAGAPPPDTNASNEIAEQAKAADQAEQEVASAAPVSGPSDQAAISSPAAPQGPPATIALGQTEDQVTSGFGEPVSIRDLGTKKVFVYKDMKVTFKGGKVTNIE